MVARHSGLIAAALLASALCWSAGVAGAQGQNAQRRAIAS